MFQGVMQKPFNAAPHKTTGVSLGAAVAEVQLQDIGEDGVLLINNVAGATDVLIEFWDDPLDSNSMRIPAYSSMIVTVPKRASQAVFVRLKRPTGSATDSVYITQGFGF